MKPNIFSRIFPIEETMYDKFINNCCYQCLQKKQFGLLHLTRYLSIRVFIILFIILDVVRFKSRGRLLQILKGEYEEYMGV